MSIGKPDVLKRNPILCSLLVGKFNDKKYSDEKPQENNFTSNKSTYTSTSCFSQFDTLIKQEIEDNDEGSFPIIVSVKGNVNDDQIYDKYDASTSEKEQAAADGSYSLLKGAGNIDSNLSTRLEPYLMTWKKIFVWMNFDINGLFFCCMVCRCEENKPECIFTLKTENELPDVAKMLRFHESSTKHKVNCIKQPGLAMTLFTLLKKWKDDFKKVEDVTNQIKRLLPNIVIYDGIVECTLECIGYWIHYKSIKYLVSNATSIYSVILHYCKGFLIIRYVDQNLKSHEVVLSRFVKSTGFKGFTVDYILKDVGLLPKNCVSLTKITCGKCDCTSVQTTIKGFNSSIVRPPSFSDLFFFINQFFFYKHYFTASSSLSNLYNSLCFKFSKIDNHHLLGLKHLFSINRALFLDGNDDEIRRICHEIYLTKGSMLAFGLCNFKFKLEKYDREILYNILLFFHYYNTGITNTCFGERCISIRKNFQTTHQSLSQEILNNPNCHYLKENVKILESILFYLSFYTEFDKFEKILIDCKQLFDFDYLKQFDVQRQCPLVKSLLQRMMNDNLIPKFSVATFQNNIRGLTSYVISLNKYKDMKEAFQSNENLKNEFPLAFEFYKLLMVYPIIQPDSKFFSFFYLEYLISFYNAFNKDSILWCLFYIHFSDSFLNDEFLNEFEAYM